MIRLPEDIADKIKKDFALPADREMITTQLQSLWTINLNVGADQLARCILILCNGNLQMCKEIFKTNFYGDPRDVIVAAMETSGHKINWAIDTSGLLHDKE